MRRRDLDNADSVVVATEDEINVRVCHAVLVLRLVLVGHTNHEINS